jgi:hypothetical protein
LLQQGVDVEPKERKQRSRRSGAWLTLTAKFVVTAICFWYLGSRIDFPEIMDIARGLHLGWATLAIVVLLGQLPLATLRWAKIVDELTMLGSLREASNRIPRVPLLGISVIAAFFSQVVPSVASDAIRVAMIRGLGVGWQKGVVSVFLDRGIGTAAIVALGIVTLLPSSGIAEATGVRMYLIEVLTGMLGAGVAGLLLAPYLGRFLERWRYTAWAGELARTAYAVLLVSDSAVPIAALAVAVQLLALISVWLVGHSLGISLSLADAGVIGTVMFASILLPISVSGWGVRELAITTLLGSAGVPMAQSFLLSILIGLVLLGAGLPGAVVWMFYSPRRLNGSPPH